MLAYAANRPSVAGRPSSPHAMLVIVGAHVALIALVMSMKMELPVRVADAPVKIKWYPPEKIPPEHRPVTKPHAMPDQGSITRPPVIVPTPSSGEEIVAAEPTPPSAGEIGTGVPTPLPIPTPEPPRIVPVKSAPQLLTPAAELKPPYPPSKLLSEEQAVLRLRLSIDERGRVVAVEPIERADPAFLNAARRHILAHWRYRPASEGGRAIASTLTITLHFQLDE